MLSLFLRFSPDAMPQKFLRKPVKGCRTFGLHLLASGSKVAHYDWSLRYLAAKKRHWRRRSKRALFSAWIDGVCIDLFPEGQSCILGKVQLRLAKEDEADKGQLSSTTRGQVMAADVETAGQNKVSTPRGGLLSKPCATLYIMTLSPHLVPNMHTFVISKI